MSTNATPTNAGDVMSQLDDVDIDAHEPTDVKQTTSIFELDAIDEADLMEYEEHHIAEQHVDNRIIKDANPDTSPIANPAIRQESPKFVRFVATEHSRKKPKIDYGLEFSKYLTEMFPIFHTIANYTLDALLKDMLAGFTIGIRFLPEAMAYAMAGGFSQGMGITVAIMGCLFYPLSGSTWHLAVGPDPIICLLMADVMQLLGYTEHEWNLYKIETGCNDSLPYTNNNIPSCKYLKKQWETEHLWLIGIVTFQASLILLFANIMKLGFISNFISKPVTEAFMCSGAIIIAFKQLHYCFNMPDINIQQTVVQNIWDFINGFPLFLKNFTTENYLPVTLTICTILILYGLHWYSNSDRTYSKLISQIPGVVIVFGLGMLFTYIAKDIYKQNQWFDKNINNQHPPLLTVGEIPDFLTRPMKWLGIIWFPKNSEKNALLNLKHHPSHIASISLIDTTYYGLIIALIIFFNSIMVARKMSIMKGYPIIMNQELMGLSLSNAISSGMGGFPCSGTILTTSEAAHSTAKTRIWSIWCAVTMFGFTQFNFFDTAFERIPKAILGAVVIESVIPLINFKSLFDTYKLMKIDVLPYILTFIVTLTSGILYGVLIGLLSTLIELVWRGTANTVTELGRIQDSVHYEKAISSQLINDRILVAKIHDSLYFSNWYPCEEAIQTLIVKHNSEASDGEYLIGIVLDFTTVGDVDSTAAFGIYDFTKKCVKQNIVVRICCIVDNVLFKLKQIGLEKIRKDLGIPYRYYANPHDCVVDIVEGHTCIDAMGILRAAAGNIQDDTVTNTVTGS